MVAVSLKKIFFKQKTAYEITDCDWSSDVCSSDLENGIILPMTWEMIECLPERYRWNSSDTTRGSWAGTELCQSMNNPDGEI